MSATTPATGDRLGEWVLVAPLDVDTLGPRWEARHHALERRALVTLAGDADGIEGLRAAAVAQGRVRDARVARPLAFAATDTRAFLAIEWPGDRSLRGLLETSGRLAWTRALDLARDLAGALATAHARGCCHGALRPEHCWLSAAPDGTETLRLTGFGGRAAPVARGAAISDGLDPESARRLRARLYVAPELRGGAPPDAAGDVYAAGVILFEMLTGEAPHGPARVRDRCPEIPEAVDAAVEAALAGPATRAASPDAWLGWLVRATPDRRPAIRFGAGRVRCGGCGAVHPLDTRACPRCGGPLHDPVLRERA